MLFMYGIFKIMIRIVMVCFLIFIIRSKIKKTYHDIKNVQTRIFITGMLGIYLGCEIIWGAILRRNLVFSISFLLSAILYIFYTLATIKSGTEAEKEWKEGINRTKKQKGKGRAGKKKGNHRVRLFLFQKIKLNKRKSP